MKRPHIFRRTGAGLIPASIWADEWMRKVPLGDEVIVDPKRPRNPGNHRRFWALLTIIADNHDKIDTAEQALEVLAAIMGKGRWVEIPKASKPLFIRDSIAYASMDEDEFQEFFNAAVNAAIKHLVPVDRDDLLNEIARF